MPNFLLISLLAAFAALSTDMYLPAIPTLQEIWNISLIQANLSLVAFFTCFSLFLLIHGPLSDRFGRRPVLLWGIVLYILGSYLCAASTSITFLVVARMVQAMGAASASALSLALAKDLYEGRERQKILAYIGVIVPLCPMVAPMLGGWILKVLSWRYIFILQGTFALSALYGVMRLNEPLKETSTGGFLAVSKRYIVLLRNTRYTVYTLSFSLISLAFFAFIGGSADIYITGMGLKVETFGLYFGFNALALMTGSFLCSRLCVGFSPTAILYSSLIGVVGGGAALLVTGGSAPLLFALPMFAISFFMGLSRPVSNNMVLEQVETDVGAASSVLIFSYFLLGAAAMEAISLDWPNKPRVIAYMAVLGGLAPLLTLLALNRRAKKRA